MPFRALLIIYILSGFLTNIKAQEFGGYRPSVKWKQLNTKPARIIFTAGNDSVAEHIANIINILDNNTINPIGNKRRKINLVLHNATTISNAYVGLGPFRSEFYLTPLQNSFDQGSIPWPDQLATHEFRHVQQYSNFNVGGSKILSTLFGQEGQALANDAAIPNWFFEGDAVYNETSLGSQGRGRLPYFFKDYLALWKEGKQYSYMKLRNGSYKDFTPDHYALGYLLVAYGYQHYGPQFWANVTHDAAAYKQLFYPFQHAIEKYSGESFASFHSNAIKFFKQQFHQSEKTTALVHPKYTNQQYPVLLDNSRLLYVGSSYSKIPAFYISEKQHLRKIRSKDISLDEYFSYKNGRIIYASFQPDIRWSFNDYSDLKLLDIASGIERSITHHKKYFAPDINVAGTKAIASEVLPDGDSRLVQIDIASHHTKSITNPNHYFYTYPKFVNDSIIISAARSGKGEMAVLLTNIINGNEEILTPFSFHPIAFPFVKNDALYFSTTWLDNDRIMMVSMSSKQIHLLNLPDSINSTGYYQPSADHQNLAYTTFTAEGFQIRKVPLTEIGYITISPDEFRTPLTDMGITELEKRKTILDHFQAVNYPITKYPKASHILNFHSVEPDIEDPVYTLNFISENILNTLQGQVSFAYDRSEGYKKAGFSFTYAGLFPYLSAGGSFITDRSALLSNQVIHFNQKEVFTGFSVPVNLSKGRSFTFLNFSNNYTYNITNYPSVVKPSAISYTYLTNSISFSHQIQQARQNIYPAFAQVFHATFHNALTSFTGRQAMVSGTIYFPGLLKNHNLFINSAILNQDTLRQISFSSGFPFSRGYPGFNFHKMFKYGVNYTFPLCYPDVGIGNLLYVLRIRSNFFYDDTFINDFLKTGTAFSRSFRSIGTEIFFDTKWFNQAPVSFGVRYSHTLDKDIYNNAPYNKLELILPVNIFHNN